MYIKDIGIILNTYQSQDADKIAVILLKEHGKLNVVFKGVKKSKSRKLNSAEIGNLIEVYLRRKHEDQLYYIREINVKNHFYQSKKNYLKFLYLNFICELFYHLISPGEVSEKTFNFLLNVLMKLNTIEVQALGKLTLYIQYCLIQINGFLPDFSICNICHGHKNYMYYIMEQGAVICEHCSQSAASDKIAISEQFITDINKLQKYSVKTIEKYIINEAELNILHKVCYSIIVNYLNKEMKSYNILIDMIKNENIIIS